MRQRGLGIRLALPLGKWGEFAYRRALIDEKDLAHGRQRKP